MLREGQRFSKCGMRADICDGGCVRGGQLEELRGPPEDLRDGVARQLSLVRPIPRHLPRLPARWQRRDRRFRYQLPCPGGDAAIASGVTGRAGLDELSKIAFVADLVP